MSFGVQSRASRRGWRGLASPFVVELPQGALPACLGMSLALGCQGRPALTLSVQGAVGLF